MSAWGDPTATPLDDLVTAMLKAAAVPPSPERVEVARDLYESMRTRATVEAALPYRPTFGAVFGIPVVIDDELAPGEFRVVPGGGA